MTKLSDTYATPVSDAAKPADADLALALEALQRVARSDCYHEPDGDDACSCDVCDAKHALASIGAWRYIGSLPARVDDGHHPRETAMHAAWRKYMERSSGDPDYTLRMICHDETTVSRRDWYVASSVVRWLATNCGSTVLRDAGWVERTELDRERQLLHEAESKLRALRQVLDRKVPA